MEDKLDKITRAALIYAQAYIDQVDGQTEVIEALIKQADSDPSSKRFCMSIAKKLLRNIRATRESIEEGAEILKEINRGNTNG